MRSNGIAEFEFRDHILSWKKGKACAQFNMEYIPEWATLCEFTRAALVNGIKQGVADAAAGADDKIAAMQDKCKQYIRLEWRGQRTTLLEQAMVAAYPAKSAEAIRKYLAGKTKAQRTKLESVDLIAEAMRMLRDREIDEGAVAELDAEIDAI